MTWTTDVQEFLNRFHQDCLRWPGWPAQDVVNLRAKLIAEEYTELTDAWVRRNLPETVDGCLDLIYVLIGAMLTLGVNPEPIWDAIHKANMAKVGGSRRNDGKIMKPHGWEPPDIAVMLDRQRRQ